MPFHHGRNSFHHARSALKAVLSLIGAALGAVGRAEWSRSIILLRKERPALTSLHAWLRRPMRDSRSL